MPLLSFWKSAKDEVLKMTIEQVVSSVGDGSLRDQSNCSDEFRTFLKAAPSERLFDYSRHCLESSFNKSGLVLQDMDEREAGNKQVRTDPELLNAKRQQAVDAFAVLKGKELVKRSRTLFWSPYKEVRVCCAVSKRYEGDYQPYWYAFHPKWDDFLAEGNDSYFVISCMDRDEAFAVKYSWIEKNKGNLNMTDRGERSYWHIPITTLDNGKMAINTSKVGTKTPLEPYRYELKKARSNRAT